MTRQKTFPAQPRTLRGLVALLLVSGALTVSSVAAAATAVTLYVRSGATGTACTAAGPCGSVAQGVAVADALTGDAVTITVGPGTYMTSGITIAAGRIASLTITGAGAASTILDGQGANSVAGGIVTVATHSTVTLTGLTFEDGKATYGGALDERDNTGTVTIARDTFSGNHANFYGGAIVYGNARGELIITQSTFTGNSATSLGGAIDQTGATMTLSDSTFSTDGSTTSGGAFASTATTATSTLTNDTFVNDTALHDGGALFASAGTTTLADTTFSADTSRTSTGAGVFTITPYDTYFHTSLSAKSSIFDGTTCGGHGVTDAGYNVETGSSCHFGLTSINTSTSIDLATALAPNTSTGPQTLAITQASSAFQEVPLSACTVRVDERTKPRPGVGSACDAGAYELQPVAPSSAGPVHRIFGSTAAGTAAAELEHAFTPSHGCPGTASSRPVVVATDQTFPDALSASYLAKSLSTGILLTGSATLSQPTVTALRKEGISHVVVVGGPVAVSTAVVTALEALPVYSCGGGAEAGAHLTVTRIAGPTAYDTAAAVAESVPASFVASADLSSAYASTNATGGSGVYNTTAGNASSAPGVLGAERSAILATGTSFPDAEAASVLSYAEDLPILLTTPGSLSSQAQAAISALHITQVIVMGGPLAVSDAVVTQLEAAGISVLRVAGKDATTTAVQLADLEVAQSTTGLGFGWAQGHHLDGIVVARGTFFSDGLAGAPLAARGGYSGTGPEPLLLTESPDTLGPYLSAFLRTVGHAGIDHDGTPIDTLTVLGGTSAVARSTVSAMVSDLGL